MSTSALERRTGQRMQGSMLHILHIGHVISVSSILGQIPLFPLGRTGAIHFEMRRESAGFPGAACYKPWTMMMVVNGADNPFLTKFRKFRKPSEFFGNLVTCSQISENFGRFLTTSTDFGPIPNIIYDTDFFLIAVVRRMFQKRRGSCSCIPKRVTKFQKLPKFRKVLKISEGFKIFGSF